MRTSGCNTRRHLARQLVALLVSGHCKLWPRCGWVHLIVCPSGRRHIDALRVQGSSHLSSCAQHSAGHQQRHLVQDSSLAQHAACSSASARTLIETASGLCKPAWAQGCWRTPAAFLPRIQKGLAAMGVIAFLLSTAYASFLALHARAAISCRPAAPSIGMPQLVPGPCMRARPSAHVHLL